MPSPRVVVFDLGAVLIDWNPRYLYRDLFDGDERAMERFLAAVCTPTWNEQMDAGRPFAEATEELAALHPDQADLIRAYGSRWHDMLGGAFEETVAIVRGLQAAGTPVYALSNWSAETFPAAMAKYPFLGDMDGILVSGEIKAIKPDPAIFREFMRRFSLRPDQIVFIDDNQPNVDAARSLGWTAFRFESAEQTGRELLQLGFDVDR
jgi:2-haloacid dehalogenase